MHSEDDQALGDWCLMMSNWQKYLKKESLGNSSILTGNNGDTKY